MSDMHNEQEAPIRAYLTYYHEGELVSAWQNFPTTSNEMEYNLGRSGIEAEHLTGILDTIYETTIEDLDRRLPRQPDLDELNHLAHRIDSMAEDEQLTFGAVVQANLHCGSLAELINLTHNLDAFDLYPGSFSAKDFGGIMAEMHANEHTETLERLRGSDDPQEKAFAAYVERLEASLDLQKYGVRASQEDNGILTANGYLLLPDAPLPERYAGPKDIPAEHLLTAPSENEPRKPSLLGALAAAKERAADAAPRMDAPEKKAPSGPEL